MCGWKDVWVDVWPTVNRWVDRWTESYGGGWIKELTTDCWMDDDSFTVITSNETPR